MSAIAAALRSPSAPDPMGRWMVDPNEHLGMDAIPPDNTPPIWEGQGAADMNNALPPQSYQSSMRAFEPPARYDPQMELQPQSLDDVQTMLRQLLLSGRQ